MIRSACGLAIVLAAAAPSGADTLQTSSGRTCGEQVCAGGAVSARIDCDQVTEDTVSCTGEARMFGQGGPTDDALVRLPGSATWDRHAGCGWFVVGGYDNSCQWTTGTETKTWALNDYCCQYFEQTMSFGPVGHSSDEPFCVVMYLDVRSNVTATSSVLGLTDYETVTGGGGISEAYDIACASGGEDPAA